jgi:signal recognition particle subunit SRP68
MDTLAARAGTSNEQYGVLLERLDQWPEKIDFPNGIVQWPPRVQPVPVKPLFLDIAWNFIEYPGTGTTKENTAEQKEAEEKKGLLGRLWGR